MVVPNRISAELSRQDMDDFAEGVAFIRQTLPFLVGLGPKERKRLSKAGDASMAFVRRCHDVAPLVEEYLPRGLEVDELRKDIELMDALQSISLVLSRLLEEVDDTRALVSSEAYAASLAVYSAAKKARAREGMDEVIRQLSRRFSRTRTNRDADPDEPDAPEELASPSPRTQAADGRTLTH